MMDKETLESHHRCLVAMAYQLGQLRREFKEKERSLENQFRVMCRRLLQELAPLGTRFKWKDDPYSSTGYVVVDYFSPNTEMLKENMSVEEFLKRAAGLYYRVAGVPYTDTAMPNRIHLHLFEDRCEIVK